MRGKRMLARMKIVRWFGTPKKAVEALELMSDYGMVWEKLPGNLPLESHAFVAKPGVQLYNVCPWLNQNTGEVSWYCVHGGMRGEGGDYLGYDTPAAVAAAQILAGVGGIGEEIAALKKADDIRRKSLIWGNKMFINRPT